MCRFRFTHKTIFINGFYKGALSAGPYTHLSGIAPKERQNLAQGGTPWDSLLGALVS